MTGIQPVASLSMPVIRKLWPKFALKEAIDTEIATLPRFVVAYTKPYMYKGDDIANKVYLPRGLNKYEEAGNFDDVAFDALSKEFTAVKQEWLVNGQAKVMDWSDDEHVIN